MFAFKWNVLSGSYSRLMRESRSYFAVSRFIKMAGVAKTNLRRRGARGHPLGESRKGLRQFFHSTREKLRRHPPANTLRGLGRAVLGQAHELDQNRGETSSQGDADRILIGCAHQFAQAEQLKRDPDNATLKEHRQELEESLRDLDRTPAAQKRPPQ